MDIQAILKYLPHRYPFLLVDRVQTITPEESITALKNVTMNEPFFVGHFPHHPVMPGVLIIEALAQAAAILGFVSSEKESSHNTLIYLAGIDHARFKRPVLPGDQLLLHVFIQSKKQHIWKFNAHATVEGEKVAECEILCALREVT